VPAFERTRGGHDGGDLLIGETQHVGRGHMDGLGG
jgi:hypothetical protein